jgi:multiple sugar transport system substrate-binding protein
MDSVQSGLVFASGEVAIMVNWFGFAAMSETLADSKVKGCVDIAQIPCEQPGVSTSLNIYWLLSLAAGSPHADLAYQFIRHCMATRMDKLLTLEGAIGCRKSTWVDPDVNRIVPFYSRLPSLHENARELPRLPNWPQIAELIEEIVLEAIQTDQPLRSILQRAQLEGIRSS